MSATALVQPHYELDTKTMSGISGSKTFGPLTLTYDIDVAELKVTGSAKLYGAPIGSFELSPQHPEVTIGGSVGIAKAELKLQANFDKKEIDYDVDIEAFGKTIVDSSGKLFSW